MSGSVPPVGYLKDIGLFGGLDDSTLTEFVQAYRGRNVVRIETTRQYHRQRQLARDQAPVERGASTAVRAGHESIEQQSARPGIILGVL